MMLTIHVLDIANGCSAHALKVEVYRQQDTAFVLCTTAITETNGRTSKPLLESSALPCERYELRFYVGDYFAERGNLQQSPRFIDIVCVDIGVAEQDGHYHIPLLITPWGYSVYRGC